MKYLILLALFAGTANACDGFYFEFGAGWPRNDYDLIEGPIGRVVMGYETDGWSVELDHQSSIPETDDRGIEALWINKRIYLK